MPSMNPAGYFAIAVLWALGALAIQAVPRSGVPAKLVSYSLPSEISLHEPMTVIVTLTNVTSKVLEIDLGPDGKDAFRFKITRPGGDIAEGPPTQQRGIFFPGDRVLEPDQVYATTLVLDQWCDFSETGQYLIQIDLENAFRSAANGEAVLAPTFRASVRVLPPDAARLAGRCAALLREALSYGGRPAAEAAEALSYASDPAAVPYLNQLLESGPHFAETAIEGLGRAGGRQAVGILLNARDTMGDLIPVLAERSLRLIESRTTDVSIKAMIEQALGVPH